MNSLRWEVSPLSFFCNHNLVPFCKGELSKPALLAQVARLGMSDVGHGLFSRAAVGSMGCSTLVFSKAG